MADGDDALDLTGLERAAERAGLPGLAARLVPPGRRRDRWFDWSDGELRVSERVVERLRPTDGEALLVNAILKRRRLAALRWPCAGIVALCAGAALAVASARPGAAAWAGAVALVVSAVALVTLRARAVLAADDDTVALLGEAETLVRAMNWMNQDELHVAGRRLDARPDVHRRAERLVELHQLRLPPELRQGAEGG